MKNPKSIFSKITLSILTILLVMSLSACGKTNAPTAQLSGKFVMATMETEGQTLDIQTLETIFDDIPNNFYVEFNEDGKVSLNFDGEGGNGTYQKEGDSVKIIMDGDDETMKLSENTLSWTVDDAIITFEKQ